MVQSETWTSFRNQDVACVEKRMIFSDHVQLNLTAETDSD